MVPSHKNCCGYCRCTFTLKRDGKDGILWQSYAVLLWSTLQEQLWLGYKQLYSGTVQVHATWYMLCVEKSGCNLFYQSILYFPIAHNSLCLPPKILHKLLLWNALGNMQTSQEHITTIVYAKLGGQTEWIMGNWKIVNSDRWTVFVWLWIDHWLTYTNQYQL